MHVPDAPEAPVKHTRKPKVANGGADAADESDDDKAARAAIPSWDDILLGVRRKRD
jgi:hypothetical protein